MSEADTAVYATRPLVETLCRLAADADPEPVAVGLALVPAAELEATDSPGTALESVPDDASVFAEFYFPGAGDALENVFGIDLSMPVGTDGRFLSHPDGFTDLSVGDDLHARVLVAVPPYGTDDVRGFARDGRRLDVRLVAARSAANEFEA